MKIGLIDVDGHNFPNLALMKISAYYKAHGNTVEWVNFFDRYDYVLELNGIESSEYKTVRYSHWLDGARIK